MDFTDYSTCPEDGRAPATRKEPSRFHRHTPHGESCLRKQGAHSAAGGKCCEQGARASVRPPFCQCKAPKTRCASFFMLRSAGTEGFVSDPPVDGKGSGVNFDVLDALAKAYSFLYYWTNQRRICRQTFPTDTLVARLKMVSISASTRKSSLPYRSGLMVNKNAAAGQPRYSQLLPTGRNLTRVGESGTFRLVRTEPYSSTVDLAPVTDSV